MADSRKHRTVELDADRIAQFMRECGWNIEDLAAKAVLSTGSVSAALSGSHPVYWRTAEKLRAAFQLDSVDELLPRSDRATKSDAARIHEWLLDSPLSKWITASNQLQFRIWRLRHEHLQKSARGKCYELQGMASAEQERCRASLLRHAEVCTRIGRHPHIINNITTCQAPSGDRWWVFDEWVAGATLLETLRNEQMDLDTAMRTSMGIASALQVLNKAEIIRRELSPQSILIEEESQRVILTEFELAKLLDGSPTVSNDEWPDDPYRAPEASSDDVDYRADIYSWGRVTCHLLLGSLPLAGQESGMLAKIKLPKELQTILEKSVSISRRSRPPNFDAVFDSLNVWKEKA